MLELKQALLDLIKTSNYSIDDLKKLLDPTGSVLSTNIVLSNLLTVVEVLIKDRNGDSKFTVEDLQYLSEDMLGLTNLVSSVILILHGIPNFSSTYSREDIEELVFRVLVYVLLVVVPEKTDVNWTIEEKEAILNLLITMYNLMQSLKITQQAIASIISLFKNNRCKCCLGDPVEAKEEIIERNLVIYNTNLKFNVINSKDKIAMQGELRRLRKNKN